MAMNDSDLRQFLVARQAKYRSHDAKALAADHMLEGSVHSPIFATIVGRPAIEHAYAALFQIFPDWLVTFEEAILDGTRAAHPCHVTATHRGEFMGLPGTGRQVDFRGVLLYTLEDGLIAQEWRLYDFTSILLQTGVLRVKPGI
jgi:predicted ester cyclase